MPVECAICNEPTNDDETPVTCSLCNAYFHPSCTESKDGKVDDCIRCNSIQVVTTQKAKKDGSKSGKSKRSSKSSKLLEKELELLEEKKKMDMELIAQREKLLQEKEAVHRTYIESKAKILKEMDQISEIDDQSATSSERGRLNVNNWLESTDKVLQGKPNQTVGFTANVHHNSSNKVEPSNLPHKETVVPNQFNAAVLEPAAASSKTFFNVSNPLSKEVLAARKSDAKNLPIFDGCPKDWPTFTHQFAISTSMCQFQDIDNIVRLRNSLKGKTLKAVHGALAQPSNVSYIMETLEQLFGKPEFIINELIKEVRDFNQLKIDKFGEIVEFSLIVTNMTTSMKAAAMSNHLWNPNL